MRLTVVTLAGIAGAEMKSVCTEFWPLSLTGVECQYLCYLPLNMRGHYSKSTGAARSYCLAGIATDDTWQLLTVEVGALVWRIFENRENIFPGVGHGMF